MKTIWLVVPCYNEEEVLPETSKQLKNVMSSMIENGKISPESKIAFVNDGSKDNTWNIISTLCTGDGIFAGINPQQGTSERSSCGSYDCKKIRRCRDKSRCRPSG